MSANDTKVLARLAAEAARSRSGVALQLSGVGKRFGAREVLRGVTLTVRPGAFVAIVGKSGCGKSTLLRLLAGLDVADEGRIEVDGVPVDGLSGGTRIMFQDARLLPWQKVVDNVALGLPGRPDARREAARQALAQVGLADRTDDWPAQLSGGQRQRVALARALAHRPSLLLLDEPLGALDALTRIEMQRLIERLWRDHGFTAVLVTHDVAEAVALADHVVLVEEGRIAMDVPVALQRPRQRGDAAYAALEGRVLDRLLTVQAIDARNQIRGKVRRIATDAVLAEVTIDTVGRDGVAHELVATVSARSVRDQPLEIGAEVVAVFKSNEVALARP